MSDDGGRIARTQPRGMDGMSNDGGPSLERNHEERTA